MELAEEITIPAPKERVYAALNDPVALKAAIPGCEELARISDNELEAKVLLKVGPVKARFTGRVMLDPSGAPDSFTLAGQGTGGAAGFAKGTAVVHLEEQGQETLLRYEARAEIGGKLAQLGSRLVTGAARKLAAQFFARLSDQFVAEDKERD